MKDKYIERKDTFLHPFHTNPNPNHRPSPGPVPTFQQQKRECLLDEAEVDSVKKSRNLEDENKQLNAMPPQGGDGSTIEVVKRPRGRPPGSKNKPKPPVVITREAEPAAAMRPHVLEIPNGHDIVDSLVRFSRRRNLGVCVLAGTGAVSNVTLHQPASLPAGGGGSLKFHGRFEILSISATFLPPAMSAVSPPAANGGMSISLAGPHGQIVGGTVAGPIITAGTVIMVVAAFNNPTFHRLPAEDDMSVSVSVSGGGEEPERDNHERDREHHIQHRPYQMEDPQREHEHSVAHMPGQNQAESCGMSMYNCHLPSDVIWAPTARPPHPPY